MRLGVTALAALAAALTMAAGAPAAAFTPGVAGPSGGKTTWVWSERDPMAPYLAPEHRRSSRSTRTCRRGTSSGLMPEIVRFYKSIYGPYPLSPVGGISDSAKNVGYSRRRRSRCPTGCPTSW
jgi:hypothetical protein